MSFIENILYTPHPTEDDYTMDDIRRKVEAMEQAKVSNDPNSFLRWSMIFQTLHLYSVVEPVVMGDQRWSELHRMHLDYVQHARDGGIVDPAYEAELIVEKSFREDEIGPMAIAA
ncbi:MAG TPA: hypothetical protein VHB51_02915 [Candidatus Saccharimonadales bacterium]|nr:hypothetical protein [Candidatus Saccharimonadales bacterium]